MYYSLKDLIKLELKYRRHLRKSLFLNIHISDLMCPTMTFKVTFYFMKCLVIHLGPKKGYMKESKYKKTDS